MKQLDYSEISPVDLRNPFRNPTELPDYAPDYRQILPALDMPDTSLPLVPQSNERTALKRVLAITFLMILFAFVTAMTCYVVLQAVVSAVLRHVDMQRLGELPENYPMILSQYLNDSAINNALTLIAFTVGNLSAFLIGCRLTQIRKADLFRLRDFSAVRGVSYIMLGLWIQLLAQYAANALQSFLSRANLPVYEPEVTLNGSSMRILMNVLDICVLAPITEELLMRGFVLKNLSRVSQRFGILLSAFIFGIMHENLPQFLFSFPLGILLAYITVRHNSLTPAIITHLAVNSMSMLISYGENLLPHSTFRKAWMLYTLVVLLLGTVALCYMLLTEHLPDLTPHQSTRTKRLVVTAPLFWLLVITHVGLAVYSCYTMSPAATM